MFERYDRPESRARSWTNEIIIVSGLPRSGTSLMMQMLDNGGIAVVTDNIRTPDTDNPRGYYEFEQVKKIKEDVSWLPETRGKAFKMVSQLLYELPATSSIASSSWSATWTRCSSRRRRCSHGWASPSAPRRDQAALRRAPREAAKTGSPTSETSRSSTSVTTTSSNGPRSQARASASSSTARRTPPHGKDGGPLALQES